MKSKRIIALAIAGVMAISALAGCGSSTQQGASGTTAAEGTTAAGGDSKVIKIGVVSSLTGGSAIYGEGAQNAITMAAEEINASDSEYKVEILNSGKVVDDAGDAKQAINHATQHRAAPAVGLAGAFAVGMAIASALRSRRSEEDLYYEDDYDDDDDDDEDGRYRR